jgi:hypothetical protein
MKRAASHLALLVRPKLERERTGRGSLVSLALAGTLLVATGCSAADGESVGTSQQTLFANDKPAYDYFVGKGLTNFQAAGVVGNLDQESGVDPTIHQLNGGVGRGIAQWSTGARWDTTDKDNVLQYAAQQGQSATSLGLQLDFMWYELTTFPEYGLADLKASTNITEATTAVEDKFEGCVYANYPECALPSRVNFANGIFKAYGANTGQGGQGGGGSGAGGSGGGGAGGGGATSGGTGGTSGSAGAAGSGGGSGGGGSGGSSGATSAGTSTVGGASVAGSSSTAGGSSTAGTTSAAGSPSVGGSSGFAGSPSAGSSSVAGSGTFTGLASTSSDSGCTFAPPRNEAAFAGTPLSWLAALLASTLTLRRRRRQR